MKMLFRMASFLGLVLVIGPPLGYLFGWIDEKGTMTSFMLVGTILWFATVPLWMGRKSDA